MGKLKIPKGIVKEMEEDFKSLLKVNNLTIEELVTKYETGNYPRSEITKNLNVRFCFDVYYAIDSYTKKKYFNMFNGDGVGYLLCPRYLGLGIFDSHIESAMRSFLPKLTRRY